MNARAQYDETHLSLYYWTCSIVAPITKPGFIGRGYVFSRSGFLTSILLMLTIYAVGISYDWGVIATAVRQVLFMRACSYLARASRGSAGIIINI